jgi:hypothetical protein
MDLDSLLAFVRDLFVLAYMFVLRIGVPIIITLMIGAWLRHLLEEKEHKPVAVTPPPGSNKRCWDMARTSETEQARSMALARPDLPCWLAVQVSGKRLGMCHSCSVYQGHSTTQVHAH